MRYQNRPLLHLLECYILKSIGELEQEKREILISIQPKLSQIYGAQGNWEEILEKVMEFPSDMPNLIMSKWEQYKVTTERMGQPVDPLVFAQRFADANFLAS